MAFKNGIGILGSLLALVQIACPTSAQTTSPSPLNMLIGFAGDNTAQAKSVPIAGLRDLDHNGIVDSSNADLFAFQKKWFSVNKGNGTFMTDMHHIVEKGELVFYSSDSGDGYILRAVDKNHNGIIDDTEVSIFTQVGLTVTRSPETMALDFLNKQVIVYFVMDDHPSGTHMVPGIYRAVDLNANGNAKDTGETVRIFSKLNKVTVAGKAGNVTIASDNWDKIRVNPMNHQVVIFLADSAQSTPRADRFVYYSFKINGTKLAGASVFFNPSKLNGLVMNADIGSGALVDSDVVVPATPTVPTRYFNGTKFCEVDPKGHKKVFPVYYFSNSNGPSRGFGSKNAAGQLVHGIVFRGVDLNLDGDLQDKGEVTLFFNGSGNDLAGGSGTVKSPTWTDFTRGKVTSFLGFVTGLAVADGKFYLQELNSGTTSILELHDKNGNNVIETGEARMVFQVSSPYPKIFNKTYGPYNVELHAIDRNLIMDPLPTGSITFGNSCLNSRGLLPLINVSGGLPQVGNLKLQIGIRRGFSNGASILFLGGSNKLLFGTVPLPLVLTGIGMTGCNLLVSADLVFVTLNTPGGWGEFPFPIPNDPRFKGAKIYLQWWTQDGSANPAGLVSSNGVELTLQ